MKYLLLIAIIVNLNIDQHDFYPSGAPLDRCGDMMPKHNVAPINEPPPYEISVSRAHHETALKKLFVNIHSKDESIHFKGFLLEARGKWDGQSIGEWTTDVKHTKTLDCFGKSNVWLLILIRDQFRF